MKHLFRLSALIAMILTMAFTALSPVAAQTPAADPVEELNKIATDVIIYGRTYEANLTGTPVPDESMPVTAIVQAYTFDNADVAEEAFPHVHQLMMNELESVIDAEFKTADVDDLGTNASLSTAEVSQGGITASVALLMVQDNEVIYLSAGVVANGPAEDLANDMITFVMDKEPGKTDAVEFNEDGTSTGGYFDAMPTDKDTDILQGLLPTEDMYETGEN
jgi:hypothetical protein